MNAATTRKEFGTFWWNAENSSRLRQETWKEKQGKERFGVVELEEDVNPPTVTQDLVDFSMGELQKPDRMKCSSPVEKSTRS